MSRSVLFDTETTGLDPLTGDRLIEVACLELHRDLPTGEVLHLLVDPERDIPEEATRVHGMTRAALRGKPRFSEIADELLAFLDTARAGVGKPATFLLDEFLELRTFESFPGLRSVLRDLVEALASSGNRFVLTSRYAARAQRLMRDAAPVFEVIQHAPLPAEA